MRSSTAGSRRRRAPPPAIERAQYDRIEAIRQLRPEREFIATCYEVLLGREIEDPAIAEERSRLRTMRMIGSVVDSDEFRANVVEPLRHGRPMRADIFTAPPTLRQRLWAADWLPLGMETRAALTGLTTWPAVLGAVLRDRDFCRTVGIDGL